MTTMLGLGHPSSGTQEAVVQDGGVKSGYTARYLCGMVQTAQPFSQEVQAPLGRDQREPWEAQAEEGGEVKNMNSGVRLSGFQSQMPHSLAVRLGQLFHLSVPQSPHPQMGIKIVPTWRVMFTIVLQLVPEGFTWTLKRNNSL